MLRLFNVPTLASGIIAASSWIYTVGGYSLSPYSVNVETGEAVRNTAAFSMTSAKLNPAVNAIYGTRDGTSPNDVEKWDIFLEYLEPIPLPTFKVGGAAFPAHGRYVFWNQSGTELYAVVQADSKALLTGGTGIIRLDVSDAKQVAAKTVVNSASQAEGRITPGEVISIYGSGMGPKTGSPFALDPVSRKVNTNLAGTEVYINGLAAPVLYASDTLVNAIVPFEVPASGQTILQVGTQGVLSPGLTLTTAAAAPGIFTMNSTGSGQAVAVNLDGTICDSAHPAAPGSYIVVYLTGGGATTPFGSTGSVAGATLKRLTQTVLATVGDVPATVTFAGAVPLLVEGVNQNLRLNERTPPGPAQPLILTVGNNSSPATATIAVR